LPDLLFQPYCPEQKRRLDAQWLFTARCSMKSCVLRIADKTDRSKSIRELLLFRKHRFELSLAWCCCESQHDAARWLPQQTQPQNM